MTAENAPVGVTQRRARSGFNEAAADDRGKHVEIRGRATEIRFASMRPRPMTAENPLPERPPCAHVAASMRPRPMTAENAAAGRRPGHLRRRFNEAAADDRGKPASCGTTGGGGPMLQ